MKKKATLLILIILVVISGSSVVFAGEISVTVDGQPLDFDQPPVIIDGRTVVPVAQIFRSLGAEVEWDGETRTVYGFRGDDEIVIQIDNTQPTVNGQVIEIDVPATIVNGRTMVPARFIAESLGMKVAWNQESQTVKISHESLHEQDENIEENDEAKIEIVSSEQYFEFDASTGTITGYDPAGGRDVEIPEMIDGVAVTHIGDWVFFDKDLTSVIIPDGVTSIGEWAFYINQLTSVAIPESITSIERLAFTNNQLTSVTIPAGVTRIEDGVFAYNQLTSVTIPTGVTRIGGRAFEGNNLTSVIIPDSVTSIGRDAFADNQTNPADLTIKGVIGSAAETYANQNGHTFVPQ